MNRSTFLFVRSVIVLAAAFAALLAGGLALDLLNSGYPLRSELILDLNTFRHINNLLNRNLNQTLAIVFTTVAIAVPLTANMYSLKFLEFFIKDPVNAAVLILAVFADLSNTWMGYFHRPDFIPAAQVGFVFVATVLSFAVLFPYLYYIFRFLHPDTLLDRLQEEVAAHLAAARRQPARAGAYRQRVAEGIEHIANIAVRSVDRADRNTAIESVFALDRVLRQYWSIKGQLAPGWFAADQDFFLGYSSAAIADLTASRSWAEMKLFGQFHQVLSAAIPRMPELTSTVAKTLRKLGLETTARHDPALREVVVEYFNTFVRLALNRRDARSVFTVFNEYRLFAEAINSEQPELGQEIAYYFQYYAQIARDMQLNFIVEAVAHDLGDLVRAAWEAQAPNRHKLLERFLEYDTQVRNPLPGVKKAQALLASYFLLIGQAEPAEDIRAAFAALDAGLTQRIRTDLLHIKREKYWEVNERRMNIDYVPEAQREKLREFFEGLETA